MEKLLADYKTTNLKNWAELFKMHKRDAPSIRLNNLTLKNDH